MRRNKLLIFGIIFGIATVLWLNTDYLYLRGAMNMEVEWNDFSTDFQHGYEFQLGEEQIEPKPKHEEREFTYMCGGGTEAMGDISQSISRPIEMMSWSKMSGAKFHANRLAPIKTHSLTSIQKACLLGIHRADLAYLNTYAQYEHANTCLSKLKRILLKEHMENLMKYDYLQTLAQSHSSSLATQTTYNFEKLREALYNNGRGIKVNRALLSGAWIESMYLTVQAYQDTQSPLLFNRIGEQKIILSQLLILYDGVLLSREEAKFQAALKRLAYKYKFVKLEEAPCAEKVKVVDGQLIYTDCSDSEVVMTPSQLEAINKCILDIREEILP